MATSLLLLLIPFVQLGISYYGSVATLMAALCVVTWRQPLLLSMVNWRTYAKGFVLFGMLLSLASSASHPSFQDVLRILREGVLFVMMTALIERFTRARSGSIDPLVVRTALAITAAFLALALLQVYALHHKVYLGFPKRLYVQNDNTIPGELDLLFNPLRPNGTFGEPSYFAFVLISMFVMFLPLARHSRPVRFMLVGLAVTGLLSQSLSFIIALPLIGAFGYLRGAGLPERVRVIGLGVVLVAAVLVAGHDTLAARLEHGLYGRDVSTYQRIVAPLSILWEFLIRHPIGATFSSLPGVLQPYASRWGLLGADILENGILNALFCYGIIGFALIASYLLSARDGTVRLYLFICASFNGALFAIDKFCIVCLTVWLYTLSSAMAREAVRMPFRYGSPALAGLRAIGRARPGIQPSIFR